MEYSSGSAQCRPSPRSWGPTSCRPRSPPATRGRAPRLLLRARTEPRRRDRHNSMNLGPSWYPSALVLTALRCAWLGGALLELLVVEELREAKSRSTTPAGPIYVEAHRKSRSIGESFIGFGYVICYVLDHAGALAGSVCGPALHRHHGAGGVRGRGDGDRAVVAITDAGPLANGNRSPYPLRDLSTPRSPGPRAVPYGAGGRPRGVLPGTMP